LILLNLLISPFGALIVGFIGGPPSGVSRLIPSLR
jgi:hypothetical protein